VHRGRHEEQVGVDRERARPPEAWRVLTSTPSDDDDRRRQRGEQDCHRDASRDLAREAERVREERAQTDIVVLGTRQVLGEETERARAERHDVREIAEADGRAVAAGKRQSSRRHHAGRSTAG